MEVEIQVLTKGLAAAFGEDAGSISKVLAAIAPTSDEQAILKQVAARLEAST